MYSFGSNSPEVKYYKDSTKFRNIKGTLLWDNDRCSDVNEELNGVSFEWNSSDDYLPLDFTYDFIKELPIPFYMNKEINIKKGITYVKFLVPIHINKFLDNFNFNFN